MLWAYRQSNRFNLFDIGHHPIHTAKEPPHVNNDIRFLLVAKTMDFVVSEESNDLAWVPL